MKESSQEKVEMPDMSTEVLKCLFSYLYTGVVTISPDNVVDILAAANLCTLSELQEQVKTPRKTS